MKGESKYVLGQNAYLKLVLHALKHKSSPTNGVLVNRCDGDNGVVEISDAVPLFHFNQIGLLPSLEIALMELDNRKLEALPKNKDCNHVMRLFTKDALRGWKPVGSEGSLGLSIREPTANVVLLDYMASQKWEEIVDFDDHLDDISKDWMNTELFK